MSRSFPLAALSLLAALAIGCAPSFDHLDLRPKSTPPLPVTLSSTQISMPIGIAVDVTPIAMAGTEQLKDASIELRPSDAGVLRVDPRFGSTDLVLSAQGQGKTELQVIVDGELKMTIPVTVEPQ